MTNAILAHFAVVFVYALFVSGCASATKEPTLPLEHPTKEIRGWKIYEGTYHGDHGDCYVGLKKINEKWNVTFGPSLAEAYTDIKGQLGERDSESGNYNFKLDDKLKRSAVLKVRSGRLYGLFWAFNSANNPGALREPESKFCKFK